MARPARHDQMLDAAAELFARNGFAATSIREVAAKANLTKAGLYYHIREKEDLLARICAFSIETILAGAHQALGEATSPRARLSALIRNHADFFWRHPHNLTVLNRDMGALPPPERERIRMLERAYLDLLRGVIREGQAAGAFRAVDPTVAAFALLTVMNNLYDWYDPGGPVGSDALVDQLETILFDGLASPEKGTRP